MEDIAVLSSIPTIFCIVVLLWTCHYLLNLTWLFQTLLSKACGQAHLLWSLVTLYELYKITSSVKAALQGSNHLAPIPRQRPSLQALTGEGCRIPVWHLWVLSASLKVLPQEWLLYLLEGHSHWSSSCAQFCHLSPETLSFIVQRTKVWPTELFSWN